MIIYWCNIYITYMIMIQNYILPGLWTYHVATLNTDQQTKISFNTKCSEYMFTSFRAIL